MTPNGLVHRSCVQEVADGDTIDEDGTVTRLDGTQYTLAACAHDTFPQRDAILKMSGSIIEHDAPGVLPTDNGWTEAAWWHSPHWMRGLHGNFKVPSNPTTASGQTIFFFPSFTPAAGTAIIQPVLQWGPSAAGGGKYWAIASWYVWPGHSVHGPLRRVSVGDVLYGSMGASACTSTGHCTWSIVTRDQTHAASSSISVKAGNPYTEVQGGVLEAYNVDSCKKYPANGVEAFYNLAFTNSAGAAVHPAWGHKIWRTTCHESIVASSPLVFLNWR